MTIPQTPTIVEVWVPWCAECKAMQPQLDEIAADHPGVDFVMLNAAEQPDDTAALGGAWHSHPDRLLRRS